LRLAWLLLAVGLALALGGCGSTDEKKSDCPSFADQQLLPEEGGPDTQYVLWVKLRDTDTNKKLESMVAQSFTVDGRSNNKTFDLVRVESNPLKYLRTFNGSEVCASDTCTLYFRVIATSQDGCERGFDTELFQVVMDQGDDDDDDNDDNDDDTQ
jgi:hypothetical protein